MVYYWNALKSHGLKELWIKLGLGDSIRFVPIHILAEKMGQDLCQVLPAVHTLTGCDYTSKVGTKHAALTANPEHYLKDFGKAADLDTMFAMAEEYLTRVLKKGTEFKTSDQLRSFIYHQSKRVCFEDLPPTSYAMQAHIRRSFFATNQLVTLLSTASESLHPSSYGFEEVDELLMADMGKHEIPEEFAVYCNCLKCSTERCTCRSKAVSCCSFCKCQSGLRAHGSVCKNPLG